jgi:hypothetical protein
MTTRMETPFGFLDPLTMLLTADWSALSTIDYLNCRIVNNGDVNFKFSEFWKKRWISTAHCGFNVSSKSKYTMIWANIEVRGSLRCPDSDESSSITCLIECKNKVSVRIFFESIMAYSRIADVLWLLLRRVSAIDCKTLIRVRDESCN